MAKDPYRYFRIEARELLDQLAKGVLDLEKGNVGAEQAMRLLRLAHTLKGAARVVKQADIADLIHGVEDMLSPYRDGGQPIPHEGVDSVLAALDAITAKLEQLPVPSNVETAMAAPDTPARMMQADFVEIDVLLEGLGEIGSELAAMRRTVASMERIRDRAAQCIEQLAASDAKAHPIVDEVHELIISAERNMAMGVERIDREVRQARDAAERLRLVPAAGAFNALERTARDAAHSLGKQVTFEASGGDVRIDGEILDSVQSALVQLVRNAVAHGIETATERQAAGKQAAGRVTLEVIRRGYRVWFRCTDDGGGVDLEAVRRAVLRKGASAADTQRLDARELLDLLLKGGITTASAVTELAGRGIGLDVVRETARRLNGDVVVDTKSGHGTTIELRVPLSLASLEVLNLETDGQVSALPLDAVQCTMRIPASAIMHAPDGSAIAYEGKFIPLVSLTNNARKRAAQADSITAVVVTTAGISVAVAVTRLRGIDTIVLRPLPALAPADPIVLGMHLDAEGNPRIVLDPEELATLRHHSQSAAATTQAPLPILIVDDSLTTRMLESSILESAGFTVELAASAEEGLEMAQRNNYALFLVDVEMPGMDGFAFVERTRADPALCNVPSILVTSRNAPEDRQRGLAAGARAYIVKGEFDQIDFLQRVTELVHR